MCNYLNMSLSEVEAAARSLSSEEKQELLRFLAIQLEKEPPGTPAPLLAIDRLARLRRMFPRGPVAGNVQDLLDFDRGLS